MCTAIKLRDCFGRNLDLDCSYNEQICIVPRNYALSFRRMGILPRHYAMIGMASVRNGAPLFYDAVNEKGLCMAGLNFPGNAYYPPEATGKDNVTPFELIPWLLSQCETVAQASGLLERMNLVGLPFAENLPLTPLHWMLSDRKESLVIESMADGLHLHANPVGVLTNNPPFDYQRFQLNNYRGLSASTPENTFAPALKLDVYCQGLGALGLPGDVSSMSRFVRAAFYAYHSVCDEEETSQVSQMFHLLSSVEMPRGGCRTDTGHWDITVYSACLHAPSGRYYYTTYDNRQISCVDLRRADLEGAGLSVFDLRKNQQIYRQN